MSQYKIVKPVDFGPWTIGDKNYGPQCPSCKVPLNNYAPRVNDTVEGDIQAGSYYVFLNGQKQLRTGRGIFFPINTNGQASTQAQSTIQFITEDHLALVLPSTPPVEPEPQPEPSNLPVSENPTDPKPVSQVGQTACWICENAKPILIGLLIFVGIVILFNPSKQ